MLLNAPYTIRWAVLFLPHIMMVLTSRETRTLWNFPSLATVRLVACRLRDMGFVKSLNRELS
jgi:hypothetical protein